MKYYWNSEVIALLNEQGFNIQATDPVELTQVSPRHRFLHMEMVRGNSRFHIDSSASNGRRFRLYAGNFSWQVRRKWEHAVKPIIIDATKPQWKRSVIRWISLAVMTLAEAAREEETILAEERRSYDRRADSARSVVADTGVSVSDVVSTFGFEFSNDEVAGFSAFNLKIPAAILNQPVAEKMKHVARLIVFLQQEGWVQPHADDPSLSSRQLLYPRHA